MISNSEILNRFDVLYNNITSSHAPGLDAYEKSVFWNKATLEVLKNHLNPKGNKYGEGFDFSPKRQIEFSKLTIDAEYSLYPKKVPCFANNGWLPQVVSQESEGGTITTNTLSLPQQDILSIVNESLEVVVDDDGGYQSLADLWMIGEERDWDADESGKVDVSDATALINEQIYGTFPKSVNIQVLIDFLLFGGNQGTFVLKKPKTASEIISENSIKHRVCSVVPLSFVEYDTLMSRPFPYPPKSQAWRIFVNDVPEFIIGPNELPATYRIRYVKVPKEVDLSDDTDVPEIPESLYDEVLQRAVELAKAAYVGDMNQQQIIQSLGERSE